MDAPSNWPFADPPNVATITTRQVIEEGYPIRLVTHDEDDGGWQVLCGTTSAPKDAMVVLLAEVYARDSSIGELADLPLGWKAWRESPDAPWQRMPNAEDEDEGDEELSSAPEDSSP